MKKIKVMTVLLALATAAVLTGCSKKTNEPSSQITLIQLDPQKDTVTSEAPVNDTTGTTTDVTEPAGTNDTTVSTDTQNVVVETTTDSKDNPSVDVSTSDVVATITLNVTYENADVDLIEVMDIPGVGSAPGETPNIIYGKDDSKNLVYRREDSSVTDSNGAKTVTIVYEFYTLKYDFDFRMDPLNPENGSNIQTINGTINYNGSTSSYTYENVGRRGQTGIWYAGICSNRNGVLGEYYVG